MQLNLLNAIIRDGTKELVSLLRRDRKIRSSFLKTLLLVALTSLFESASLAIFFPLLSLIDPSENSNFPTQLVNSLLERVGITSLLDVAPIALLLLLTSTFLRLYLIHSNQKLSASIAWKLAIELNSTVLDGNFQAHWRGDPSGLRTCITVYIEHATQLLNHLLNGCSSALLALGIAITLFISEPTLTSFLALYLIIIYLLIGLINKKSLKGNSSRLSTNIRKAVQAFDINLANYREIMLSHQQEKFSQAFSMAFLSSRKADARARFVALSPKPIIEGFTLSGIVILICLSSLSEPSRFGSIINISFAIFGLLKVLPHAQQLYVALTGLRTYTPSTLKLLKQIAENSVLAITSTGTSSTDQNRKTDFRKIREIKMKDISLYDKGQNKVLLANINLQISLRCSPLGIVGESGSGKSTLLDVLIGLIEPHAGILCVDGHPITEQNSSKVHLTRYQKQIAICSNSSRLMPTTLWDNFAAFSNPPGKLDSDLLQRALTITRSHAILDKTGIGLNDALGPCINNLSNGEYQRLLLTRAICQNPRLLILDEATNALDSGLQEDIINLLVEHCILNNIILVMVAHREETLTRCKKIVRVTSGRLNNVYLPLNN